MKLKNEYIRTSHFSKYDLNNPYDLNGEFTHIYFISPSIASDKT